MQIGDKLKEFVEFCIKNLVEDINLVDIKVVFTTKSIIINVAVSKKDLGRVIGKKGRTIDSIKLLTIAIKNTHFSDDTRQVNIELLEEDSFIKSEF